MALPGEKEILTILNVKNLNLCRYDEVIDIHIEKTYDDISSTKTYNGKYHKNPLSDVERLSLKEQGVPDLFIEDIDG